MQLSHNNFQLARAIKKPKYIVFSDFDETYMAHNPTNDHIAYLRQLEKFIMEECFKRNILFGWVTGSTESSLLTKIINHKLTVLPHFIAHSLGTELVYFNHGIPNGEYDLNWQKQLLQDNYTHEKVQAIVKQLYTDHNIFLMPQKSINNSKFKSSYYYHEINERADLQVFGKINALAMQNNLKVNFSKCNPLSGDPIDCYDVDWIPELTGKLQIVKFLAAKYKISYENMYAFGDSQNDIEMLELVKHGYLVANALKIAKTSFNKVAEKSYAEGILKIIDKVGNYNK